MADATTKVVAAASEEQVSDGPHLSSWLSKVETINAKIRISHTISRRTNTFFTAPVPLLCLRSFPCAFVALFPFPPLSWLCSSPALGMIYPRVMRTGRGRRVATREVSCLSGLVQFKKTHHSFSTTRTYRKIVCCIPAVVGRRENADKQLSTLCFF